MWPLEISWVKIKSCWFCSRRELCMKRVETAQKAWTTINHLLTDCITSTACIKLCCFDYAANTHTHTHTHDKQPDCLSFTRREKHPSVAVRTHNDSRTQRAALRSTREPQIRNNNPTVKNQTNRKEAQQNGGREAEWWWSDLVEWGAVINPLCWVFSRNLNDASRSSGQNRMQTQNEIKWCQCPANCVFSTLFFIQLFFISVSFVLSTSCHDEGLFYLRCVRWIHFGKKC